MAIWRAAVCGKLHAYTLPRPEGANSRVKDVVDMAILLRLGTLDRERHVAIHVQLLLYGTRMCFRSSCQSRPLRGACLIKLWRRRAASPGRYRSPFKCSETSFSLLRPQIESHQASSTRETGRARCPQRADHGGNTINAGRKPSRLFSDTKSVRRYLVEPSSRKPPSLDRCPSEPHQ